MRAGRFNTVLDLNCSISQTWEGNFVDVDQKNEMQVKAETSRSVGQRDVARGGGPLPHWCESTANLLGGRADSASIGMKGGVYAKRGTAFGRLGHQQVAPSENPFGTPPAEPTEK